MLNGSAAALPGEEALLLRLERASKRIDGPVYSKVAVRNDEGALRLVATTFTESEEDAITILLADAGLNDELLTDYEVRGDHGHVEHSAAVADHPEFACIYSKRPPNIVRLVAKKPDDPGPDPSWLEFYMPRPS